MALLKNKAQSILNEKNNKIKPENIKKGVQIFDITGTLEIETVSVEEKDVNFYDYDGTRLYSYTLAEVQEITELPDLPSHEGLICQGWNWTLADIKAEGKETDVGAMYITDDGKTRLYIEVGSEGNKGVQLYFRQTVSNGVEIDWGDGSTVETFSGSGTFNINPSHNYSHIGKYIITLNPINDCKIICFGATQSPYTLMGRYGYSYNSESVYVNRPYKIELGGNLYANCIDNYAFAGCHNLETITIPNNITYINSNAFSECFNLKCVILPNSFINSGSPSSIFSHCGSLCVISFPHLTGYLGGDSYFSSCTLLKRICIPKNINFIGGNSFLGYCTLLSKISLPTELTMLDSNSFLNGSYNMTYIKFGSKLSSIGNSTFALAIGMRCYDFSECAQIPTLGTNVFNSIVTDCKIVVPDSLYEDWIAATNWSDWSNYIIKKSDWDNL